MGTVTGTKPQSQELTVTGGSASGGCVWIEDNEVTEAPADAGTPAVEVTPRAVDQQSCLHVDSGEQQTLTVEITPERAANGVTSGTLTIALASDTNPDLLRTSVSWTAPLQKPVDSKKAVELTAILMAIGLLFPLLLMLLLNWLTAKFPPPSQLKVAKLAVVVTASGAVFRRDRTSGGLVVDTSDFTAIDGATRTRSFDVHGVRFHGKVSLSPFAAPVGRASKTEFALGSLPPATTGPELDTTPVPFGLAGAGVVLLPVTALDEALEPAAVTSDVSPNQGRLTVGGSRPLPTTIDEQITVTDHLTARPRPDLEVTLLLFVPAGMLGQYAKHFDAHHSDVAAIVDSLFEVRRKHLAHRAATNLRKRTGKPDAHSAAPSAAAAPGEGPPSRIRLAAGPPPSAPHPQPAPTPSASGRTSDAAEPSIATSPAPSSTNDPFGPPPGRTR